MNFIFVILGDDDIVFVKRVSSKSSFTLPTSVITGRAGSKASPRRSATSASRYAAVADAPAQRKDSGSEGDGFDFEEQLKQLESVVSRLKQS